MAAKKKSNSLELGASMDYDEHNKTFALFTFMTKWGTIGVIGIVVLLALLTL